MSSLVYFPSVLNHALVYWLKVADPQLFLQKFIVDFLGSVVNKIATTDEAPSGSASLMISLSSKYKRMNGKLHFVRTLAFHASMLLDILIHEFVIFRTSFPRKNEEKEGAAKDSKSKGEESR